MTRLYTPTALMLPLRHMPLITLLRCIIFSLLPPYTFLAIDAMMLIRAIHIRMLPLSLLAIDSSSSTPSADAAIDMLIATALRCHWCFHYCCHCRHYAYDISLIHTYYCFHATLRFSHYAMPAFRRLVFQYYCCMPLQLLFTILLPPLLLLISCIRCHYCRYAFRCAITHVTLSHASDIAFRFSLRRITNIITAITLLLLILRHGLLRLLAIRFLSAAGHTLILAPLLILRWYHYAGFDIAYYAITLLFMSAIHIAATRDDTL